CTSTAPRRARRRRSLCHRPKRASTSAWPADRPGPPGGSGRRSSAHSQHQVYVCTCETEENPSWHRGHWRRRALSLSVAWVTRQARPGATIVWRSVDREKRSVQTALPWNVVRHDEHSIVLFMRPGTVWKVRTGRYGGPRDRMLLEWDGAYAERIWTATNVLMFHRFGDAHSLWLARDDATSRLAWWYVNLEEPWHETAIGFDSRDNLLDRWSGPDGEWHWKDEDELAWAIAQGWVGPEREAELRKEGERALERFRRRDPPLDDDWLGYRPDPSWTIPTLPSGWPDYEPRAD